MNEPFEPSLPVGREELAVAGGRRRRPGRASPAGALSAGSGPPPVGRPGGPSSGSQDGSPRRPAGRERHVVVCDADPASTAAHAAALAGAGYAVTVCSTVGACVPAVRRVGAAVVVLGLLFPDGDGLELLVRLAAEVQPRPRLIMVSAVRAAEWAGPVGADAFLRKPVSRRRLIGAVRTLLQEDV